MHIGKKLLADAAKIMNIKTQITGWIANKRKHKNLTFIELRDYTAVIQVIINEEIKITNESYVEFTGIFKNREVSQINNNIAFGSIEFEATNIKIISESLPIPFSINDSNISDDIKTQYRFLFHRSEQSTLRQRSEIIWKIRTFMQNNEFFEVNTPIITSPSPEGARDFLIPSRMHPGKFYAMPQSPQIFKQILMVGGLNKYYQIAPCFRDEDARSDRCFGAFYQLDVEITEPTQEQIFDFIVELLKYIFNEFIPDRKMNINYITYDEAIHRYGTDKPNLNIPLFIEDFTSYFKQSDMMLFANAIEKGCVVKAVRSKCKNAEAVLKNLSFKVAYATKIDNQIKGPIGKFVDFHIDDSIFFICDTESLALKKCNLLIKELAQYESCTNNLEIIIVKDFPMFEYENNQWNFCHNPFSMPQDTNFEESNLKDIKAFQYDIVCNGYELISGSIRNSDADLLIKAFKICGYSEETVQDNFRCILNALRFGAPPHGGFALGIERLIMIILNITNIRDIEPFPINTNGYCPLTGAPITIDNNILKDYKLKII